MTTGLLLMCTALPVQAAEVDGATLSPWWGAPFALMLIAIALFPVVAASFWHAHFGKVAAACAVLFLVPFAMTFGTAAAAAVVVHALIAEYLPFIALLASLYTIAGGICVQGRLRGGTGFNVGLLALGGLLASLMGTTGAAMLLIRPLLRANAGRAHRVHLVVFFIFVVANAGGALTPLGDPPLFLGFLKGVGFMWTVTHLAAPMIAVCALLLSLFACLDHYFVRKEARSPKVPPAPSALPDDQSPVRLDGKVNFILLAAVIGFVLMSGLWQSTTVFDVFGTPLPLQNLIRDVALFALLGLSLLMTPQAARTGNQFDWGPILEVAKLFAAVFVTIAPVIAMLAAGAAGPFASLLAIVHDANGAPRDGLYFWTSGLLSGFLDNAPTYLVFFNLAGGDAQALMHAGARTLTAISAGAVFMGALSYIGNAPNFMIKAIAEERGVTMPSFFGFLAWSFPILLPIFGVVAWVFF